MPTSIHDIFTEFVVEAIRSQLRWVDKHDEIAAIVDMVRSETTSDIFLYGHELIKGRYPKRSPDASRRMHEEGQRTVAVKKFQDWRRNGKPWSAMVKRFGRGFLLLLPKSLSDEK